MYEGCFAGTRRCSNDEQMAAFWWGLIHGAILVVLGGKDMLSALIQQD